MRNLSVKQGVIAAAKSDTLSILTFEIGLFGWMALTFFVFFHDSHLRPIRAGYWFMMQIGMILGFFTSYPMNRWLIKSGWKEAMGSTRGFRSCVGGAAARPVPMTPRLRAIFEHRWQQERASPEANGFSLRSERRSDTSWTTLFTSRTRTRSRKSDSIRENLFCTRYATHA
jgi:hypothetical protein